MKKNNLIFPALRCRMGDWIYYVTYFQFSDISEWIKFADEVHKNPKLSQWIQRRLNSDHTKSIEEYLLNQSERFFNSIVVGIYGGQPQWLPIKVSSSINTDFELSEEQLIDLESSIGLLKFNGNENIFAIDGQHRVAGIKKALKESSDLKQEEVCAIFVGHENTPSGMERTRRLFTTLNKTAKKVSNADIVAFDEDDGFAVVTRRLVDESEIFDEGDKVAFISQTAIPSNDRNSIASIIGIYQIAQDLYPQKPSQDLPKKSEIKKQRPSEQIIEDIYQQNCQYWMLLKNNIPEYHQVFVNTEANAKNYRSKDNTHLLFRYVGQRAFASAVQVLMSRDKSMEEAVRLLASKTLCLQNEEWHYILWNPIEKKIITKNRTVAETYLLRRIGESGATSKNEKRLDELIASHS